MDEIFETETPERQFERYFADTLTNVLPARGSEHQVPASERAGYRTLVTAETHDYHRCVVWIDEPITELRLRLRDVDRWVRATN